MTPPRTLTVRTPEDVLALVVTVLGFQPAESVVMVTRTATASFHARADLPTEPASIAAVAEHLASAAEMNQAREAIVVTYCGDPALSQAVTSALVAALGAHGIDVDLTVREHGGRWYGPDDDPSGGTAYDLADHPFVLESRFLDREIYRDRAELAASLRGPRERVVQTEGEMSAASRRLRTVGEGGAGEDLDGEVSWMSGLVDDGLPLTPAVTARVVVALSHRAVRDGVWLGMNRLNASAWKRRLKEAVRATPTDRVAEPAALLAFSSWLAGDGALAWCAVDLARSVDPDHVLAALVAQALENAVPPSVWDPPTGGTVGPGRA